MKVREKGIRAGERQSVQGREGDGGVIGGMRVKEGRVGRCSGMGRDERRVEEKIGERTEGA